VAVGFAAASEAVFWADSGISPFGSLRGEGASEGGGFDRVELEGGRNRSVPKRRPMGGLVRCWAGKS